MDAFQAPDTVLMIRPAHFGYNPETSGSNAFQVRDDKDGASIRESAISEFDGLVKNIRNNGVNVIVMDDTEDPQTPDAIFPNNWISTHHDGTVILYPMLAPSRRLERRSDVLTILQREYQFDVKHIHDLSAFEDNHLFLEGTGSVVFDYVDRKAYANLSTRTHEEVLQETCEILEYEPVIFTARDNNGLDIYHANVLMCIADTFAVVCLDCLPDTRDRKKVRRSLEKSGHEVIDITFDQLTLFAGNMMQLRSDDGRSLLIMSDTALYCLTADQKNRLSPYAQIVHSDLKTIEKYGGGSARCMITGIFLPKLDD